LLVTIGGLIWAADIFKEPPVGMLGLIGPLIDLLTNEFLHVLQ
jgi:hypothetical protein